MQQEGILSYDNANYAHLKTSWFRGILGHLGWREIQSFLKEMGFFRKNLKNRGKSLSADAHSVFRLKFAAFI
ncbi:hypothetical protein EBS43_11330 [bacterium]|nr:hypothetical protein [bacterium]